MRSLRRLVVLVLAFGRGELRGSAGLFRGLALQYALRVPVEQVLNDAHDQAVLLWSRSGGRARPARTALGAALAVVVGLTLVIASNALLLVPLTLLLRAAGMAPGTVAAVRLAVVAIRLGWTALRAARAYHHDRRLLRALPAATGERWRVDYLAAWPQGQGRGGPLLTELLRRADAADVEVVLDCAPELVAFYRRHGFRALPGLWQGRVVLRRTRPSQRRGGRPQASGVGRPPPRPAAACV